MLKIFELALSKAAYRADSGFPSAAKGDFLLNKGVEMTS